MKSFAVALCFVVVAVWASSFQERWNRVHQECQKSPFTFVPDVIFEQLKRGENPSLPANFGLHANCMLTKLGLQNEQGHALPEEIRRAAQRELTDRAKIDQIVTDCSIHKYNSQETALYIFKCLGENRVNIGQL